MRTIYLDSEFKCHITDDGNVKAVETDFFDGKCDTYVEGHRFVPAGETWIREDGTRFTGPMVSPWRTDVELKAAQAQYEADTAALTDAYLEGVNSV